MTCYCIDYEIRGKERKYFAHVDARDLKSAKKKLGRKHGYKSGKMIRCLDVLVCGYC